MVRVLATNQARKKKRRRQRLLSTCSLRVLRGF
jgi:hypothetical protein